MAEQLRLEKVFVQGGAVHLDEGSIFPLAVAMDRLGDQLLAGAGLSEDEDRRAGGSNLLDRAEDLLHTEAFANDVIEGAVSDPRLIDLELPDQPAVLEGRADLDLERLQTERLGDVVERSRLHRFDSPLDRAVGGHDEGDGPFIDHPRPADHIHAAGARHLHVGDDEIENRFLFELLNGRVPIRSLDNFVIFRAKRLCDPLTQSRLVLSEQDLLHLTPAFDVTNRKLRFPSTQRQGRASFLRKARRPRIQQRGSDSVLVQLQFWNRNGFVSH